MNYIKLLSILTLLALISCSPRTTVRLTDKSLPPWDPAEGFALVTPDEEVEINEDDYIGFFALQDGGLTIKCDYYTMLNLAKEKAFASGANVIKITKVKEPDFASTCYRLYGRLYHVEDYKKYETKIHKTEERKLVPSDFKGDHENRPWAVRSVHKIEFYWERSKKNGYWYYKTDPVFMCKDSYFNPEKATDKHLEIENVKFDITEKYARLIIKAMKDNGIINLKQYNKKIKKITDDLVDRWDKESDLFLYEIQEDPGKLNEWKFKIEKELREMDHYKMKKLLIKV